jgi:cysteine-rich repeat protein
LKRHKHSLSGSFLTVGAAAVMLGVFLYQVRLTIDHSAVTLDAGRRVELAFGYGPQTNAPSSVAASFAGASSVTSKRLGPPQQCGNGVVEPSRGEECDLGHYNGLSPECSRFCKAKFCGDGVVSPESDEECEPERGSDGALVAPTCGKSCTVPTCDEAGCVNGCRWQFLPRCAASGTTASAAPRSKAASAASASAASASAAASQPSVSAPVSASAGSEPAAEATSSPQPEPVEQASSPEGGEAAASESAEVEPAACADGIVEGDEACDDGNTNDGDGCSASCTVETSPRPRCGDGLVATWEQCDDGDANSDSVADACRLTCRSPYCGDGVTDMGEQCDDGNDILGDGCTPTCVPSLCGNGILEIGEECDEGKRNSDTEPDACSMLCLMPRCGDGILDPSFGERCDAGIANAATPDTCRPWCAPPRCGDGIQDSAEECDDGNIQFGDGCDVRCAREAVSAPCVGADCPGAIHAAAPTDLPIDPYELLIWLTPVFLLLLVTAWAVARYVRSRRA